MAGNLMVKAAVTILPKPCGDGAIVGQVQHILNAVSISSGPGSIADMD